jgi:hypothetical protein
MNIFPRRTLMTIRFLATFFACLVSSLGGASQSKAQVTAHPHVTISNFPLSFFAILAHLADGPSGGSIFDTDVSIESTSTSDDLVQVNVYGNDGLPLTLATAQMGTASSFTFTIPPDAIVHITTTGQGYQLGATQGTPGTLAQGYAVVDYLSGTGIAFATYTLSTQTEGPVTSVAVPSSTPGTAFDAPTSYFDGYGLVNLGSGPLTVNFTLFDSGGDIKDLASLLIGSAEHTSFNKRPQGLPRRKNLYRVGLRVGRT